MLSPKVEKSASEYVSLAQNIPNIFDSYHKSFIKNALGIEDLFDRMNSESKDQKGLIFELLSYCYLVTTPVHQISLKKVWHHSEIPEKIFDALQLQRPEVGVDFIGETHGSDFYAIQCKYHQNQSQNVTYSEISTFLSMTERKVSYEKIAHRYIMTSAFGLSDKVQRAHPRKLGFIGCADFLEISSEQFNQIKALLSGSEVRPVPKRPKPHQTAAIHAAEMHFSAESSKPKRAKIIHPCGSGKSLTSFWISKSLKAKTTLVAVPSLSLVKQTLATWSIESCALNLDCKWLVVCSDQKTKEIDDPVSSLMDLGIKVETDPSIIASNLQDNRNQNQVVITTYQSADAIIEATQKINYRFDLAIFDEAHKTTGQKDKAFGRFLFDENISVKNRLFLTATEKVFVGNKLNHLSMDDEEAYGPIIHQLTFKKALDQNPPILSDYKIVTVATDNSEINKLIEAQKTTTIRIDDSEVTTDLQALTSAIAISKTVKQEQVSKMISFHRSIDRAKDFKSLINELRDSNADFMLPSPEHISGKMNTGQRSEVLRKFINTETSLVTNARCLTEGVDIPSVDTVIFCDPKKSKIDIVQAAGRALRLSDSKKFGYIIIPVTLNDDGDVLNDLFENIWQIVSALAMQDERIIEELKTPSQTKNKKKKILQFIGFEESALDLNSSELLQELQLKIVDALTLGWTAGIRSLEKFVSREGHALVPSEHFEDGFNLGTWISNRRTDYKKNKLNQEKITELEAFPNWTWNVRDKLFDEGMQFLRIYCEREGSSRVLQTFYEQEFPLGAWVHERRQEFKQGKLPLERRQILESLPDWSWAPKEDAIGDGIEKLKRFVSREGHCFIPSGHIEDGLNLSQFCSNRRADFKKGKLRSSHKDELEAIKGWFWSDIDESFHFLEQYEAREGHTRVPAKYIEDGFKLGQWVQVKRRFYLEGRLSEEMISRLESKTGWEWNAKYAEFLDGIKLMHNFALREGHALVPQRHIEDGFQLGHWVNNLRQRYKKDQLLQSQIKEIEAIAYWVWDVKRAQFEEGLQYLKLYMDEHKDTLVKQSYVHDDFALGTWVNNVRQRYKKGTLPPDFVSELESLPGWVWQIRN